MDNIIDNNREVIRHILTNLLKRGRDNMIDINQFFDENGYDMKKYVDGGLFSKEELLEYIKICGNAQAIYSYAKSFNDISINIIEELSQILSNKNSALYIYKFAHEIKGAQTNILAKGMIKTKSIYGIYHFARDISCDNINELYEGFIGCNPDSKCILEFAKNVTNFEKRKIVDLFCLKNGFNYHDILALANIIAKDEKISDEDKIKLIERIENKFIQLKSYESILFLALHNPYSNVKKDFEFMINSNNSYEFLPDFIDLINKSVIDEKEKIIKVNKIIDSIIIKQKKHRNEEKYIDTIHILISKINKLNINNIDKTLLINRLSDTVFKYPNEEKYEDKKINLIKVLIKLDNYSIDNILRNIEYLNTSSIIKCAKIIFGSDKINDNDKNKTINYLANIVIKRNNDYAIYEFAINVPNAPIDLLANALKEDIYIKRFISKFPETEKLFKIKIEKESCILYEQKLYSLKNLTSDEIRDIPDETKKTIREKIIASVKTQKIKTKHKKGKNNI